MEPDFTGFVTKSGIKCADGRTIMAHAFRGNDGQTVPLVWQHQHNDPDNVLGHVVLHSTDEGVRGEGFFNDTPSGQQAKALVKHKDITNLSIYANQLVQQAMNVVHGMIREVSLVLSGANPGAFIDNVNIAHGDGTLIDEEAAVIYTDEDLVVGAGQTSSPASSAAVTPSAKPALTAIAHGDEPAQDPVPASEPEPVAHAATPPQKASTVQEVIDSMNEEQRQVLYALVGQAMDDSASHSDSPSNDPSAKEGSNQVTNVFDQSGGAQTVAPGATLTHSDIEGIFASARKGGSLKAAVEEYALSHNIDDISTLFPYDQAVTDTPEFISRRTEWVNGVLSGTRKTPFSRIRSWSADITFQEARAKGYIKGDLKKEEFFRIARRITTPQTIYKKQKLDRDDILDITEFDVVQWLQTEMRLMLDEELARAILIGDGRDVDDPDKIDTSNVRPIYGDDAMYTTLVSVDDGAITTSADAIVDSVVKAMRFYRGSGGPTLYTTRVWLAKLLLAKDTLGRRLYPTLQDLSAALGVSGVVPCEALEDEPDLIGIVVNLSDYTVGADRGGQVSMFDFFDIDYNQFKYLMETRVSGAMTKYRGALAITQFTGAGGLLADPPSPTFDSVTGVGTIPSQANVTYVSVAEDGTETTLSSGAQAAIASGTYVTYRANPAATYEFVTDSFEWTFRRD